MWPILCKQESQKVALAESTGLDQKQINNWFINQRKRHWKPSEDMQFVVMDAAHPHYYMDHNVLGNPFQMDISPSFLWRWYSLYVYIYLKGSLSLYNCLIYLSFGMDLICAYVLGCSIYNIIHWAMNCFKWYWFSMKFGKYFKIWFFKLSSWKFFSRYIHLAVLTFKMSFSLCSFKEWKFWMCCNWVGYVYVTLEHSFIYMRWSEIMWCHVPIEYLTYLKYVLDIF